MRIAVIGATGVLGRHLVPRLIEAGHEVRASYRQNGDGERLRLLGAAAVKADILVPASLRQVLDGCHAVLHAATHIPPPSANPDWSLNDRIRRQGTADLIAACREAGCVRYVQQSIAMILNTADDRPQVEDDPVSGPPHLRSAIDAETLTRQSGLDWRIIRGGMFYGPGTGLDERWRTAAATGELKVPGDGSGYLSLVHMADMAAATLAVLVTTSGETVWNIVDDEPVRVGALFDSIAALAGHDLPQRSGQAGLSSFRVSNARIKSRLGWTPRYPSWRSGLAGPI